MSMIAETVPPLVPPGLAAQLRDRTRALHTRAERAGIVRDILRGTASRDGYALLLRNLLPAYRELETGLDRHSGLCPAIDRLALRRVPALTSDLEGLAGADWAEALRLLPAGLRYAHRIKLAAARADGILLLAHAYARYLGDLSGGQIMRTRLANTLGLDENALAFYRFPALADVAAARSNFRAELDRIGTGHPNVSAVVREAEIAFRLNIHVAEAVRNAA